MVRSEEIEIVPVAVEIEIGSNRIGVRYERAEREAGAEHRYAEVLDRVRAEVDGVLIEDTDFVLEPEDFLDRNHMNWWQGRAKFSAQIVDHILKA